MDQYANKHMNATTERNLKVHGDERISARTKKCKESDMGSDKNTLWVNFNRSVLLDLTAFTNRKRKIIIGPICVLQPISLRKLKWIIPYRNIGCPVIARIWKLAMYTQKNSSASKIKRVKLGFKEIIFINNAPSDEGNNFAVKYTY